MTTPNHSHILVFPLVLFRTLLNELAGNPARPLRLDIGCRKHPGGCDWLVRRVLQDHAELPTVVRYIDVEPALSVNTARLKITNQIGKLRVHHDAQNIRFSGTIRRAGQISEPLSAIWLVGPGMHRIPLGSAND